ncbi:hypothetical protein ARMSODRAFT_93267 [Armillaria solidipes]|uniref:Uncharacterized protein n=1 Tax=Armillaria solidipes TaxID=1076256 RepID=A0A2H3C1V0_9AGAR|nr:hypothetical protein ARMSODRAFT_93267 [Armillaria solidipes]
MGGGYAMTEVPSHLYHHTAPMRQAYQQPYPSPPQLVPGAFMVGSAAGSTEYRCLCSHIPSQPRGRASSTGQQFDRALRHPSNTSHALKQSRRRYAQEDTSTFRNTSIMFSGPSTLTLEDNGMRSVSFVKPDITRH